MATTKFQQPAAIVSVLINAHECPTCGIFYGLSVDYERRRKEDGKGWYCPNGHSVMFTKSLSQRERERADELQQRLEAQQGWATYLSETLEGEKRSHAATKGQLTKTRKRIQNGVCPDCHRHFTNLERHMHSKHPGSPGDASNG